MLWIKGKLYNIMRKWFFKSVKIFFFFKCYKRDLVWFCVKLVFIDVVEEASLVSYLYARKAMQHYVFLQSDWLKVHKGEGNSVKVYQTLITKCECGDAALLGKISRTWSWMCLFYIISAVVEKHETEMSRLNQKTPAILWGITVFQFLMTSK